MKLHCVGNSNCGEFRFCDKAETAYSKTRFLPYQKQLRMTYKGVTLPIGYRLDLLVDNRVVVEVKHGETLLPIHEAQLLTYLKLGGYQVGLLLNFNVPILRDGIRRKVLGLEE